MDFRLPAPLVFLLLAACGSDNSSTPVAPPVTSSIQVGWDKQTSHGGVIQDLLVQDDGILVAEKGTVWRFDPLESSWQVVDIVGHRFVETVDGYIFTNMGFRLAPGGSEWDSLGLEGPLWLGEDGRRLFTRGDTRTEIRVSNDNGETWSSLPETPDDYLALHEWRGDLYAAVSIPDPAIWRLPNGGTEWQELPVQAFLMQFATTSDGLLVAAGGTNSGYWSSDGDNWQSVTGSNFGEFSDLSIVGRDHDDKLLLADWDEIYSINAAGQLQLVLQHAETPFINSIHEYEPSKYLIGAANGVWEFSDDGVNDVGKRIGVPGDFIYRLFHLSDGTYASAADNPGSGAWTRFDETSLEWEPQLRLNVIDALELGNGDQLLATSFEGGYGDLFRWRTNGTVDWLVYASASIVSVAVNESRWFIAHGFGREAEDYRVKASTDEGLSWKDTGLDASGPQTLKNHCGKIHAAGADGLHVFDAGDARWKQLPLPSDLIGADVNTRRMLIFSEERLWLAKDCGAIPVPVALPEGTRLVDVALDHDGGIWAAARSGGIYRAPGAEEWQWFTDELPQGELAHVSVDGHGRVWTRIVDSGIFSGEAL